MPTNKLWIEHTERAAWDTVQSLRRQIEEERTRVARLSPIRENLQRILEMLDAAGAEHGIAAERYADLVAALSAELKKYKEERDQLAERLDVERRAIHDIGQRVEVIRLGPTENPRRRSPSASWFAERIADLRREQLEMGLGSAKPSMDRLIAGMEAKLEELEDAPRSEIVAIAVELGALCLRIAELGDGSERRAGRDEEE
jgi:chromosome segregation ATPase